MVVKWRYRQNFYQWKLWVAAMMPSLSFTKKSRICIWPITLITPQRWLAPPLPPQLLNAGRAMTRLAGRNVGPSGNAIAPTKEPPYASVNPAAHPADNRASTSVKTASHLHPVLPPFTPLITATHVALHHPARQHPVLPLVPNLTHVRATNKKCK